MLAICAYEDKQKLDYYIESVKQLYKLLKSAE